MRPIDITSALCTTPGVSKLLSGSGKFLATFNADQPTTFCIFRCPMGNVIICVEFFEYSYMLMLHMISALGRGHLQQWFLTSHCVILLL